MKKIVLFLSLVVVITNISCSDNNDDVQTVSIRIQNVSSIIFDEVQVGGEEMIHENIAPDKFSEYLEYETAYRYAYIQIKSGAETYTLQPIDFVGETPLAIGLYTYELDVDVEGNVILNFVIDF